jgi:competence protein ComEA
MNNDLQTANNRKHQKEGMAREKFVLFCFALFFVFHVYLFWASSQSETQQSIRLLPRDDSLGYLEDGGVESLATADTTPLQNPAFAPFFFLPIAINQCDKQLLMSIKGVGPGLADKILHRRDSNGFFLKPADLLAVDGIGPGRLRMLTPHISFNTPNE